MSEWEGKCPRHGEHAPSHRPDVLSGEGHKAEFAKAVIPIKVVLIKKPYKISSSRKLREFPIIGVCGGVRPPHTPIIGLLYNVSQTADNKLRNY